LTVHAAASVDVSPLKAALALPGARLQVVKIQTALDHRDQFIPGHCVSERKCLGLAKLGRAIPVAQERVGGVFMAEFLEIAQDQVIDMIRV
jgi:hypothetical protein